MACCGVQNGLAARTRASHATRKCPKPRSLDRRQWLGFSAPSDDGMRDGSSTRYFGTAWTRFRCLVRAARAGNLASENEPWSLNACGPADRGMHGKEAEAVGAGRVRRQRWLEFKRPIPRRATITLGVAVWVIFFALWEVAVAQGWVNAKFMPPPHLVVTTLYEMLAGGSFVIDIGISIYRIFLSFALACLVAVPLGILNGLVSPGRGFLQPARFGVALSARALLHPASADVVRHRRHAEDRAALHRRAVVPHHHHHGSREGGAHRAHRDLDDARRRPLADLCARSWCPPPCRTSWSPCARC